jgi:Family of unknown function (DUF6502)
VRAAASRARLGNSRINQSAVAAITGLTRPQVRSLLRPQLPTSGLPQASRVDQLIVGWTTDPLFATSNGRGRVLSLGRGRHSFAALVKKYGADITPRALLSELKRLRLVRSVDHKVHLTRYALGTRAPRNLRNLSVSLGQVIRAPEGNDGKRPLKVTHAEITYPAPTSVAQTLLQRRVGRGLQAFLADVETATTAATRARAGTGRPSPRMSKLSVLLIAQD